MSSALRELAPLIPKKRTRLQLLTDNVRKYPSAYVLLIPGLLFFFIFRYIPMYGIIISFKDYNFMKGIFGSDWVGFRHFRLLFSSPEFFRVFRNTMLINIYKLIFFFPVPIILALLLNEIISLTAKRTVQTIVYFPHFLSWVVVGGLTLQFFGAGGIFSDLLVRFGGEPTDFVTNVRTFRGILVVTAIWKEAGWGSILFLAALSAIDPQLYEAAYVDGANRWQQTIHVSIPGILTMIFVVLILRIGRMMTIGFEQIFVLYSPLVYETGDVFGTYIYRTGLLAGRFSYATAVGLFRSVVSLVLVYASNRAANALGGRGIW